MPIFLIREARYLPDAPRLEHRARWRWLGTVDAPSPEAARRTAVIRQPRFERGEVQVTSLLSWLVELGERRKAARHKLSHGVDANV